MYKCRINSDADRENIRALMTAANIPEEEAVFRLSQRVLVTFDETDRTALKIAHELYPILYKTLDVDFYPVDGINYRVELVIGQVQGRSDAKKIFSIFRDDRLIVSQSRIEAQNQITFYPLLVLISACYLAGAVIGQVVGDGIPNLPTPEFEIPFDAFSHIDFNLIGTVDIGEAYLAGAGAVGNGFLWAARHVSLKGILHVADKDTVSAGNRQRQIWFEEQDIGKYKAEILCERSQPFMSECLLKPAVCLLEEHPNRFEGPWLPKVIVGVDSRRARRCIQNEYPGEVFDASTTGSAEIVIHYNKQPTDMACMSCLYYHNQREVSLDEAIAEQLRISIAEVQNQYITPEIAERICAFHTTLNPKGLVGVAFATLYKELCGAQKLRAIDGGQVIAPFAFVSVLAGALLLLEVIRRQAPELSEPSNFWRLSPWGPPIPQLRQSLPRRPQCECCGRPAIRNIQAKFWSKVG